MTIQEAIERVCRAEPNSFSPIEMTEWLSRLDMQIQREIIDTHEGGGTFGGYCGDTPPDTPLLVPAPYDLGIYLNYLEAEIHKRDHEAGRYNQSANPFSDTRHSPDRTFWDRHISNPNRIE